VCLQHILDFVILYKLFLLIFVRNVGCLKQKERKRERLERKFCALNYLSVCSAITVLNFASIEICLVRLNMRTGFKSEYQTRIYKIFFKRMIHSSGVEDGVT
jgi:hypothetical protein